MVDYSSLVNLPSDRPELGLSKLSAGVSQHLVSLRQLGEGGGPQLRQLPLLQLLPHLSPTQSQTEAGQHWPHYLTHGVL